MNTSNRLNQGKLSNRYSFLNAKALVLAPCVLIGACSDAEQQSQASEPSLTNNVCTEAWFEKVDKQVVTGDGQGHGPDLGSMEWHSVVEFKLGIRGDESLPDADSELWCRYIDQHVIK